MGIEIKAPAFPESIADGEVAAWHKSEGEAVSRDELIVEIETDKVVLEVVAPADGVISKIYAKEGDTVHSEQLLAEIEQGAAKAVASKAAVTTAAAMVKDTVASELMGPAARQLVEEHKLDISAIPGSGKNGRISKEDILNFMNARDALRKGVPMPPSSLRSRCGKNAGWSIQRAGGEASPHDTHARQNRRATAQRNT